MKNAIKIMLVIGAFSFSNVFAGSLTPSISTPNFFVSVQGAFIRPQTAGTAFTIIDHAPFPDGIDELRGNRPLGPLIHIVAPYKLAGGASAGYLFPSGIDFELSFFINNHNRSRTLAKDGFYTLQNAQENGEDEDLEIPLPLFDTILAHGPVANVDEGKYSSAIYASSRFNHRTSIVNLVFGYWRRHATQYHTLWVHPHIGLNISKLHNRQKTQYKGVSFPPEQDNGNIHGGYAEIEVDEETRLNCISTIQRSKTLALGPLLGIDFHYAIAKPLTIEGRVQFGMLMGRVRAKHEETFLSEEIAEVEGEDFNRSEISNKSDPLIIRYFNTQIGLNYHFNFSRMTATEISVGYRLTEYSSPNVSFASASATDPIHMIQLFESSGFHGPFLSITQHIA